MNQKKLIAILVAIIIVLVGITAYFAIMNKINQPANISNVIQQSNKNKTPTEKSDNKNTEWKNFSFNGDALSFKYPTQWCFDNNDCRKLYVTKNGDDISISQAQNQGTNEEYIEPVLSISYIDGIDQAGAEKYLKNKYKLSDRVSWIVDKTNSSVRIAELKSSRVFAAFSQNLGTMFSFGLQPACLFDCQIDGGILNSIKLDGVSFYRE